MSIGEIGGYGSIVSPGNLTINGNTDTNAAIEIAGGTTKIGGTSNINNNITINSGELILTDSAVLNGALETGQDFSNWKNINVSISGNAAINNSSGLTTTALIGTIVVMDNAYVEFLRISGQLKINSKSVTVNTVQLLVDSDVLSNVANNNYPLPKIDLSGLLSGTVLNNEIGVSIDPIADYTIASF